MGYALFWILYGAFQASQKTNLGAIPITIALNLQTSPTPLTLNSIEEVDVRLKRPLVIRNRSYSKKWEN